MYAMCKLNLKFCLKEKKKKNTKIWAILGEIENKIIDNVPKKCEWMFFIYFFIQLL